MKNVEAILAVKFQSSLSPEDLMQVCHEDLETFRKVPGLVEKYYLAESSTGAICGFYQFDSKESRSRFWNSALAATIPSRYGVIEESLRVEEYDMAIVLNQKAMA